MEPITFSFLALPFCAMTFFLMVLASSGKSLGLRSVYERVLRAIFEWGKEKLRDGRTTDGFMDHSRPLRERHVTMRGPAGDGELLSSEAEGLHSDAMKFVRKGVESIVEDEVTQRFDAAELPSWNLLTRTNANYQYLSFRLTVLWSVGFFVRYFILLPFRFSLFCLGMMWLMVGMTFLGFVPPGDTKIYLNRKISLATNRILARTFSAIVKFHDLENRPKSGIVVANHTSPIDCLILSMDNCYSFVGQSHGGFLGLFQRSLNCGTSHVWFERSENHDRSAVARRLAHHVADENNLPILIFPEGTCVNNTSVMMFKKGTFEIDSVVYPVAIKYDPIFGDPFWNSSKQSMLSHIVLMMTSWAIVCDVYYLPPCRRKEGENAMSFAGRVKSDIALRGGLVELEWDGGLKRALPKREMLEQQQKEYSDTLIQRRDTADKAMKEKLRQLIEEREMEAAAR